MEGRERTFAAVAFGVHGVDHLLKRLFPPLVPIWAIVFGFPLWQLGLLMGARTFGSAVGQAPMGVLADRYDRRYLLPAGFAVMGAGIFLLAAVPLLDADAVVLAAAGRTFDARFVTMAVAMLATGVGSSVVHPAGYPLITANVGAARKGAVLGLWGSASKLGDGAAPAIVGVALLAMAWNEILGVMGVLAAAYAVALFVMLGGFDTAPADRPAPEAAADDAGGDRDNRSYVYPMLAVSAYFVLLIAAAGGVNVFLPEFIASDYGYAFTVLGVPLTTESTASFYYSAVLLVAAVAQLGTGALVDRFDERRVIVAYVCVAAGALGVLAVARLSPGALMVVLGILGAALWGMNPARDAIVSEISPVEREGRTFGYVWTAALLATAGAPAVVGYIGDVAGLRAAFLLLAGVVLLSALPIIVLGSDRVYRPAADASERAGAD